MSVVRTAVAVCVFMLTSTSAWAQRVTKVPDGDTLVVQGVGKVRLLGIKSADQPALGMGPSTAPPQTGREPGAPATPAVSGHLNLSPERPSRDFLRRLALGRTVRIEYDPLVGSNRDRGAYLFLEDGTLLNAEMLKAGQARLDTTHQFVREQEFRQLETQAQSAAIGIWIRR